MESFKQVQNIVSIEDYKVIDSGNYTLAANAADMAKEYVDDAGKEAILQLFISLTEFTGNAFDIWTLAITTFLPRP